jgi:LysM repeat protein
MRAKASRRRATAAACGTAAWSLALALSACGSVELDTIGTQETVVVTEYATLPPPTTTIPPTTTLPPEPGSVLTSEATYVVVAGDYPFQVAARFGVDFEEFVALNGWTIVDGVVPEWPIPGTPIRIPVGAVVPGGPSVLEPLPTTTTTTDPLAPVTDDSAPDAGTDPETATATTVDNGVGCGTYTVMEGDYPVLVATKLNTTVEKLATANDDTAGYGAFYVGLKINVPC